MIISIVVMFCVLCSGSKDLASGDGPGLPENNKHDDSAPGNFFACLV